MATVGGLIANVYRGVWWRKAALRHAFIPRARSAAAGPLSLTGRLRLPSVVMALFGSFVRVGCAPCVSLPITSHLTTATRYRSVTGLRLSAGTRSISLLSGSKPASIGRRSTVMVKLGVVLVTCCRCKASTGAGAFSLAGTP